MMGNPRLNSQPAGGRAARDIAIVQENELGPLRSHARFPRPGERLPRPNIALSTSQQQQCVCLPDAQAAPAAGGGITHIHHEVIGRLYLMKPMARVRFSADAPDQLGPSEATQCFDELTCEATHIDFDALRQKSKGASAVPRTPRL